MHNPLTLIYTFFAFLLGLCIGSFCNVLICRIPRGIPFANDTSKCTVCGQRIKAYDLIPILSYIVLGGKCRRCKAPFSLRYPLVELLGGLLGLAAFWFYGASLAAISGFLIFMVLMVISFIDAEHMIIPDGLVISLAILLVAHIFFTWDGQILSRITGFFILSVPMYTLTLFIKDAFGGGDIKLIAVCGFLLGFSHVLVAGFIAVMLGGVQGIYSKYIKKSKDSHIAFGQYICIGVFVALLFGSEIVSRYLALFIF